MEREAGQKQLLGVCTVQVCDGLGITLHIVPMTDAYWERVVAASVTEIRAGCTPNPDVREGKVYSEACEFPVVRAGRTLDPYLHKGAMSLNMHAKRGRASHSVALKQVL